MDPTSLLNFKDISLVAVLMFLVLAYYSGKIFSEKAHREVIEEVRKGYDAIIANLTTQLEVKTESCDKWEARAWESHKIAGTAVGLAKDSLEVVKKDQGAG